MTHAPLLISGALTVLAALVPVPTPTMKIAPAANVEAVAATPGLAAWPIPARATIHDAGPVPVRTVPFHRGDQAPRDFDFRLAEAVSPWPPTRLTPELLREWGRERLRERGLLPPEEIPLPVPRPAEPPEPFPAVPPWDLGPNPAYPIAPKAGEPPGSRGGPRLVSRGDGGGDGVCGRHNMRKVYVTQWRWRCRARRDA